MSLLQMSISGAIMIIAIIVVRTLAVNRLPKRVFLILWEIVQLRLLVPFSIPSMLSAYSFISKCLSVQNVIQEAPVRDTLPQATTAPVKIFEAVTPIIQNEGLNISIWLIIWIVGMVLCASYFLISYFRCWREFQTSLPVRNAYVNDWLKRHSLKRTIKIRQSDRISAPLTYGVISPVILMPKKIDWENDNQLQYVLMHEYIHICRFDTVFKLIATLVLCIHWFNPLVWVMYILYNRDIELACDERVVRQFGDRSKSTYAMTLITMEEKKSGLTPLCNNFSKNAIEERITAIMKTKKLTIGLTAVSVVVIGAIVVLFATSAKSEDVASREYEEVQSTETAEDYYQIATDFSTSEVEQFAANIRDDILTNNWVSLSEKISYPITLSGITVNNSSEFLSLNMDDMLNQEFRDAVGDESCREMFCNWQGIMMGATGQVWLGSVDNGTGQWELKIIGINDMLKDQPFKESRERNTVISYMLEGMQEEMPATLYVGEGFSIYIPDEGWGIYDETLESPALMAAVLSSEISVWIECYETEQFFSVEERLLEEGYTYDTNLAKLQKLEGNILTEVRLYEHGNDIWTVFSTHNTSDTDEWGTRLDAIAKTFAVTRNIDEEEYPPKIIYEGCYFDVGVYQYWTSMPLSESPMIYCEIWISNVTETTFDFLIKEVVMATDERTIVLPLSTAKIMNNGWGAIYEGEEFTLSFEFPDSPDTFPKNIMVDGWEKLKGNTYMNKEIPGHESG